MPLLPYEFFEPRDMPAIEFYELLCERPSNESFWLKRLIETSADCSLDSPSTI